MFKDEEKIIDAVDELKALEPKYDSVQKRNKQEGFDRRFHGMTDRQKAALCIKGERRARNKVLYADWLARGNKATPLIYIPPNKKELDNGKI